MVFSGFAISTAFPPNLPCVPSQVSRGRSLLLTPPNPWPPRAETGPFPRLAVVSGAETTQGGSDVLAGPFLCTPSLHPGPTWVPVLRLSTGSGSRAVWPGLRVRREMASWPENHSRPSCGLLRAVQALTGPPGMFWEVIGFLGMLWGPCGVPGVEMAACRVCYGVQTALPVHQTVLPSISPSRAVHPTSPCLLLSLS